MVTMEEKIKLVRDLKAKSNRSGIDCKRALHKTKWNFQKALRYLKDNPESSITYSDKIL